MLTSVWANAKSRRAYILDIGTGGCTSNRASRSPSKIERSQSVIGNKGYRKKGSFDWVKVTESVKVSSWATSNQLRYSVRRQHHYQCSLFLQLQTIKQPLLFLKSSCSYMEKKAVIVLFTCSFHHFKRRFTRDDDQYQPRVRCHMLYRHLNDHNLTQEI